MKRNRKTSIGPVRYFIERSTILFLYMTFIFLVAASFVTVLGFSTTPGQQLITYLFFTPLPLSMIIMFVISFGLFATSMILKSSHQ